MSKIAIVFWSGTGNTKAMAEAVAEGAKGKGAEVTLFTPGEFQPSSIPTYDGIAFGCPAMGAEVLEEEEFEPMFSACEFSLKGKRIALFGSFGWGDGEWMRDWEKRCATNGATLVCDSVICNDAPGEETLASCKALGEKIGE